MTSLAHNPWMSMDTLYSRTVLSQDSMWSLYNLTCGCPQLYMKHRLQLIHEWVRVRVRVRVTLAFNVHCKIVCGNLGYPSLAYHLNTCILLFCGFYSLVLHFTASVVTCCINKHELLERQRDNFFHGYHLWTELAMGSKPEHVFVSTVVLLSSTTISICKLALLAEVEVIRPRVLTLQFSVQSHSFSEK